MPEFRSEDISTKDDVVSIVIVARNEEKLIENCLRSICRNVFPSNRFELILVDDHSSDATKNIALSLKIDNLTVLDLSNYLNGQKINSYKKYAQKVGVDHAKGSVILFTDADTEVDRNWLNTMYSYLKSSNKKIATGPISITKTSKYSLFSIFQSLDIMGTMIMTGAGHRAKNIFLANGANMILQKDCFQELEKGSKPYFASGDDVFLMQNMAFQDANKVGFVKSQDAVVKTIAEPTVAKFLSQRLRWATKTTSYGNRTLTNHIGIIYLFNILLFINLVIGILLETDLLYIVFALFLVKMITEYLMLCAAQIFFKTKVSAWSMPILSVMNHYYLILIGTLGLIKTEYSWKNRKVK